MTATFGTVPIGTLSLFFVVLHFGAARMCSVSGFFRAVEDSGLWLASCESRLLPGHAQLRVVHA